MMRAKQFVIEWSNTAPGITDVLLSKGYTSLGKGVDQSAFLEPGGKSVLKIFGTQPGIGTLKFTPDQKMFIFWADYCKSHSANPFLPKFAGWETFEFDGDKYLQIRMERLAELPEETADALANISGDTESEIAGLRPEQAAHQVRQQQKDRRKEIGNDVLRSHYGSIESPARVAHSELAILLGKNYKLLVDTISKLHQIGNMKGWQFDLHGGNFMHRNDGTPVIVDPWVAPKHKQG